MEKTAPGKREVIDLCDSDDEGPTTKRPKRLVFLSTEDSATLTPYQQNLYHVQQPDRWSCGYRNTQMLLIALVHTIVPDHPYFQHKYYEVPSVTALQTILEQAWAQGWDPKGARHYKSTIVGKTSFVGAVEVSTIFWFLNIANTVVQFIKSKASREALLPFCRAYFASEPLLDPQAYAHSLLDRQNRIQTASTNSQQLPLYLQWTGHSVTIVGVEDNHLLLLDPNKTFKAPIRFKPRLMDYQVVLVTPHAGFKAPGAVPALTAAPHTVRS